MFERIGIDLSFDQVVKFGEMQNAEVCTKILEVTLYVALVIYIESLSYLTRLLVKLFNP